MPQLKELEKGAPIVHDGSEGTDSDSDDSIPELEDAGAGGQSTGQSQVSFICRDNFCGCVSMYPVVECRLLPLLVCQKS